MSLVFYSQFNKNLLKQQQILGEAHSTRLREWNWCTEYFRNISVLLNSGTSKTSRRLSVADRVIAMSTKFWHWVWENSIKGNGEKAQQVMMPLRIPVWCTALWQTLLPEAFKPGCYIYNLCRQGSCAKYWIRKRVFSPGWSTPTGPWHKSKTWRQTNKQTTDVSRKLAK